MAGDAVAGAFARDRVTPEMLEEFNSLCQNIHHLSLQLNGVSDPFGIVALSAFAKLKSVSAGHW